MTISEQVARFLDAQQLAVFDPEGLTGNVFIQSSPAEPHVAYSIYTTGGPPADRRGEYIKMAVQIIIRTVPGDPRDGEAAANAVIRALNGYSGQTLVAGGNYIIDTEAVQAYANNIGQDNSGRFEYSQNFLFEYKL